MTRGYPKHFVILVREFNPPSRDEHVSAALTGQSQMSRLKTAIDRKR